MFTVGPIHTLGVRLMLIEDKLSILADAAKYDVSCSSSGSRRHNSGRRLGNAAPCGICHTYTEDGRCVSLLKILYTNVCIYRCRFCAFYRTVRDSDAYVLPFDEIAAKVSRLRVDLDTLRPRPHVAGRGVEPT